MKRRSDHRHGQHPNSRKNLKPAQPGEVRNPDGRNGSEWLKGLRDFFERPAAQLPKGTGLTRARGDTEFDILLKALRRRIVMGSDPAIKLATEQLAGRARQQIEVSGPGGAPLNGPQVKLYLPSNGRDVPVADQPPADDGAKDPEEG